MPKNYQFLPLTLNTCESFKKDIVTGLLQKFFPEKL